MPLKLSKVPFSFIEKSFVSPGFTLLNTYGWVFPFFFVTTQKITFLFSFNFNVFLSFFTWWLGFAYRPKQQQPPIQFKMPRSWDTEQQISFNLDLFADFWQTDLFAEILLSFSYFVYIFLGIFGWFFITFAGLIVG